MKYVLAYIVIQQCIIHIHVSSIIQLIGLVKVSLHQFYLAYSSDDHSQLQEKVSLFTICIIPLYYVLVCIVAPSCGYGCLLSYSEPLQC